MRRAAPLGSGGRSAPAAAAPPAASQRPSAVRRAGDGRPGGRPSRAGPRAAERVVRPRARTRRRPRRDAPLAAASAACRGSSGACSCSRRPRTTSRRARAREWRACWISAPRACARLERRGLRRLRGLARGGCGMGATHGDGGARPAPATWPSRAATAVVRRLRAARGPRRGQGRAASRARSAATARRRSARRPQRPGRRLAGRGPGRQERHRSDRPAAHPRGLLLWRSLVGARRRRVRSHRS